MDLNEARKVVWIGSNRRPLGELLDIGYLNQERLTWAVEHVKNPTVQQAAAVLLDWLNKSADSGKPREKATSSLGQETLPGLELKLTLEKAREVPWPFSPYKGESMGPLVESRKLSLKDLSYAIDNAWDSKVREAAIALTAVRLRQIVREPLPPKGHLKVYSRGRSFSERRQLQIAMIEGLIYGFFLGIGAAAIYYFQFIQEHKTAEEIFGGITISPGWILAIVLALGIIVGIPVILLAAVEWGMKKLDGQVDRYRKGQEGETKAADIMAGVMNGEWSLFRNLEIPGWGGDVDAVLVGPTGMWAMEIKNISGRYRNTGDRWDRLSGDKWAEWKKNPSRQARKNAARLGAFLKADGITQWVNPVVIWTDPDAPLEVENPSVAVWKLERLEDELGNMQEGKRMAENERGRILEKLRKVIESRK
ncbi:MAG: NERD domain-containing protein [Anaerolineales bacterium]|nr:NERD domain-containing protein [Anaerolineales bacterium]